MMRVILKFKLGIPILLFNIPKYSIYSWQVVGLFGLYICSINKILLKKYVFYDF